MIPWSEKSLETVWNVVTNSRYRNYRQLSRVVSSASAKRLGFTDNLPQNEKGAGRKNAVIDCKISYNVHNATRSFLSVPQII
ncbi:MAG TPA: hypothetical protein DIT97_05620 [Gimesia maris]|uniref:Uncharacterized protein n=1 Tax=Gimesia maris TaxID=122 RepID=A0A3D3R383_9PLAN|nr:hypothetical protein [Gimesia maris]